MFLWRCVRTQHGAGTRAGQADAIARTASSGIGTASFGNVGTSPAGGCQDFSLLPGHVS